MVTEMTAPSEYRAARPRKQAKDAARKPGRKMPKGPGVHINVSFGGQIARKGEWILERRKTPLPASDPKEDDTPTYAPGPDESRAQHQQELIRLTKHKDVESDDLPTLGPGKKTPTPAPAVACEEKMLDPESIETRTTSSFAPPPPVSISGMGEILKFEEKGTSHKIIAKRKKPEAEQAKKPGITPRRGEWALDEPDCREAI